MDKILMTKSDNQAAAEQLFLETWEAVDVQAVALAAMRQAGFEREAGECRRRIVELAQLLANGAE